VRRRALGALALAALFGLTACNPALLAVTVEALTTPPTSGDVSSEQVTIAEGTGVGVKILAYTEDPETRDSHGNHPKPLGSGGVTAFSDDETIAKVTHVDGSTYIVTGTKAGHTNIVVSSNSADGFIKIPLLVEPQ